MRTFLATLTLALVLACQVSPAWATCTFHTYMVNGRLMTCTPCCTGNLCNTTCI